MWNIIFEMSLSTYLFCRALCFDTKVFFEKKFLSFQANFMGPNIFRGRVEQYHPKYLTILDSALEEQEGSFIAAMPGTGHPATAPIPIEKPYAPALGGTPTGSPRHWMIFTLEKKLTLIVILSHPCTVNPQCRTTSASKLRRSKDWTLDQKCLSTVYLLKV